MVCVWFGWFSGCSTGVDACVTFGFCWFAVIDSCCWTLVAFWLLVCWFLGWFACGVGYLLLGVYVVCGCLVAVVGSVNSVVHCYSGVSLVFLF